MRKLCVFLVLIIGCVSLPAVEISYNFSIPTTGNPATIDFGDSAMVPLFDPGLGTLLEIRIDLEGTINGTQLIDNEDNSPIDDGTGSTTVEMILSNTAAGPLISVTPVASFVFNVAADNDAAPNFAGPDSALNGFNGVSEAANAIISDAAVLAIFTGNGDIQLDLGALGSFAVSPGGNLATFTFTEGIATGTVTYVYQTENGSEIPEPITMLLIGGGLGLMGLSLRRRNQSATGGTEG